MIDLQVLMKTIEIPANRRILLPKGLFKPSDKVALLTEGNVLIIKKLESPRLSSVAKRAKGRSLSLRTIVHEVHAYRRAHRAR